GIACIACFEERGGADGDIAVRLREANAMIRHQDQRPVVRLEREADVGLGAAIGAHRRPFTRWERKGAPELRTLECATRYADDHARALRPALDDARGYQGRREGKGVLDGYRGLYGCGYTSHGQRLSFFERLKVGVCPTFYTRGSPVICGPF